jgi:MYXO-CTERM domain-containing protein
MTTRTALAHALVALGIVTFAPAASANSTGSASCTDGRCSTASTGMKLEGKDSLFTTIDTGWMPSCADGQDHCNKGLQVRAGLAFTAATKGGALFTAALGAGAAVQASWEDQGSLVLRSDSIGKDSTISVSHSIAPEIDLYVDVGPIEQNFSWSDSDLMNALPGAHFDYVASGSAAFTGWGFDGAPVAVVAPPLPNSQIFSVDLSQLKADKLMKGVLALNARANPTFTYKTTKITVDGHPILLGTAVQLPFPAGDLDFIDLPADIEGTLSAKGDIEVLPSVTLSQLGDMNFSPAMAVTFSSVEVKKTFDTPPQTYKFPDKKIHVPLPNMKAPREGLDGGAVSVGGEGQVGAVVENTGEAQGQMTLSSSDPRFAVPSQPVIIAAKGKTALPITFRPDGVGSASATITAHTNDPDTPELTFTVTAEGVEGDVVGGSGGKKGKGGSDGDDDGVLGGMADGCGCKTAGAPAGTGYAGLGAAALALGAVLRRRRR